MNFQVQTHKERAGPLNLISIGRYLLIEKRIFQFEVKFTFEASEVSEVLTAYFVSHLGLKVIQSVLDIHTLLEVTGSIGVHSALMERDPFFQK